MVLGIGAGGIWLATGYKANPEAQERADAGTPPAAPKGTAAERDRDYLMLLETLFELDGLANGKKFWLKVDDQPGFTDLRGGEASMVLARAFDPALKAAESTALERRKLFVDWHKLDSKDWRPEFVKRYPERAVINDEIAVAVRDLCSQRQIDISAHLVDQQDKIAKELFKKADADPELNARLARNAKTIIEDEWHEYRIRYLGKQGPKLVEEVRAAVRKMDSIVRLKKKVEAAAPPRKEH